MWKTIYGESVRSEVRASSKDHESLDKNKSTLSSLKTETLASISDSKDLAKCPNRIRTLSRGLQPRCLRWWGTKVPSLGAIGAHLGSQGHGGREAAEWGTGRAGSRVCDLEHGKGEAGQPPSETSAPWEPASRKRQEQGSGGKRREADWHHPPTISHFTGPKSGTYFHGPHQNWNDARGKQASCPPESSPPFLLRQVSLKSQKDNPKMDQKKFF